MDEAIAPVLVTGATGNVGTAVVLGLRQRGIPFVVGGMNPDRIRALLGEPVDVVPLDLSDPATYEGAVRGMRGLFLLRPPPIADVRATLDALVDRALSAGVEHVTFLSVEGADRQRWVPHHAVEAHLAETGVSTTILRPGFFAQNLGGAYRADIRDRDEIFVPAGAGRVAFVDVRDVGELAARTFAEAALRRQAWTLTGPEAVSFEHIAAVLTTVLGRPIRYRAASIPGYAAHLRREGVPWMQVLVQTVLHVGLRFGNAAHVDPALARLLGRPPSRIESYIADHRALWERAPRGV
ncbi:MAG: NmrA family NAD(P)-binding protein [Anaeromyxobacteraceae bacterium]